VDERKEIYQTHVKQSKDQDSHIEQLSAKVDSLKDILDDIEKQERFVRALPTPSVKPDLSPKGSKTVTAKPAATKAVAMALPKNIEPQLPTPGKILIGIRQKNECGVTNKVITIQGRPDATVTTPFSGVVRFSGQFKKHKNLLIIEHP